MQYIKPMLPTLSSKVPDSPDWLYEIKYDGFRCQLHWDCNEIKLYSRNGNNLIGNFPEMKVLANTFKQKYSDNSFILDGELCCLERNGEANFENIQYRGRLKNEEKIKNAALLHPATYVGFDVLRFDHENIKHNRYMERTKVLHTNFSFIAEKTNTFSVIKQWREFEDIWSYVKKLNHEGIIAKQKNNTWNSGKRTIQWLKIKNYKLVKVVVRGYEVSTGYFIASVFKGNSLVKVGSFIHGMSEDEQTALRTIIEKNAVSKTSTTVMMEPKIAVSLHIIGLYKGSLREPRFISFQLNQGVNDCTWEQLTINTLH